MNVYDDKRAYLVLLRSEHRGVKEMVDQISATVRQLGESQVSELQTAELVGQFTHLRQELERHFGEEEKDGCLDEAVARCPSLGHKVDGIKDEHPRLIEQLNALITQANRLQSGPEQSTFIHRWERFVAELDDHEESEDRLLLQGLESAPTQL